MSDKLKEEKLKSDSVKYFNSIESINLSPEHLFDFAKSESAHDYHIHKYQSELLEWLKQMVEDCKERVIDFDKSNMPLSKSNSEAMGHAYTCVIKQIESLKCKTQNNEG